MFVSIKFKSEFESEKGNVILLKKNITTTIEKSFLFLKSYCRIKEYNFSNSYRDESVRIAMLSENHEKWPIKSLSDFDKYQLKFA